MASECGYFLDDLQELKKILRAKSFENAQLQAKLKDSEGEFYMTAAVTESTMYMCTFWRITFIKYSTLFEAHLSAKDTLLANMHANLMVNEGKFQELQTMNEALNHQPTLLLFYI